MDPRGGHKRIDKGVHHLSVRNPVLIHVLPYAPVVVSAEVLVPAMDERAQHCGGPVGNDVIEQKSLGLAHPRGQRSAPLRHDPVHEVVLGIPVRLVNLGLIGRERPANTNR